jgi:phosphoglycolate phosphatase
MLKLAFDIDPDDPRYAQLKQRFLDIYVNNIAVFTRLFAGMETVIEELESRGIQWGIVTNKPAYLTNPLIRGLALHQRTSVIVSGDPTPHAKPHPEPILHACRLSGVSPAETIYVGDAARDIEAGRSAGTRTLIALFGYLSPQDKPDEWQADGAIRHPMDLLKWL